jgi:rsbT co-antagonist protein RsbR
MADKVDTIVSALITRFQKPLLEEWLRPQAGMVGSGTIAADTDVKEYCTRFLAELHAGLASGATFDMRSPGWNGMRELLEEVSRSRAAKGFSPSETASFVFSLKGPLFALIQRETGDNAARLAAELQTASLLLDRLGLYTTEVFQKNREEIIGRQQEELLELSTPVVRLWEGIVAVPLIGTLDSNRTQVVMESLLQEIVSAGAQIAIIDITGVPTVDTLVAQHLLKTVSAARLMGADCIISGIRPQIAQTIVHLAVELSVTSKASMAGALELALKRIGKAVVDRRPKAPREDEG